MARRPIARSNGLDAQDGDEAFDSVPPPSTLAAQLAQHQKEPGGIATFHQLLNEIIANPDTVESNVEENYQLAAVIAEAGLKVQQAPNPFNDQNAELRASLKVIEIAFRRNPDVLFFAGPGTGGPGSQLCLLLLPRLFSIMIASDEDNLALASVNLIQLFCTKLAESSTRWTELPLLLDLLQSSAEDILLALRNNARSTHDQLSPLKVPSAETLIRVAYRSQPPVATKSGQDVPLHNFDNAMSLAHKILSICFQSRVMQSGSLANVGQRHASRSISLTSQMLNLLMERAATFKRALAKEELVSSLSLALQISQDPNLYNRCAIMRRKTELILQKIAAALICNVEWTTWGEADIAKACQFLDSLSRTVVGSDKLLLNIRLKLVPLLDSHSEQQNARVPVLLRSALQKLHQVILEQSTPEEQHQDRLTGRNGAVPSEVMDLDASDHSEDSRPTKKRKPNQATPKQQAQTKQSGRSSKMFAGCVEELCHILGNWDPNDLRGLDRDVGALFADLSKDQQSRVLELLSILPCQMNTASPDQERLPVNASNTCRHCGQARQDQPAAPQELWDAIFRILASLVSCATVQASKESRIILMFAVQRFTWHTCTPQHLSLVHKPYSALAEWCLHTLRSSVRELRLTAAGTLPSFMQERKGFDGVSCQKNRIRILQHLRDVAQTKDTRYPEAIISALARTGDEGGDEELELVLLQLTDFLGHPNPVICSLSQLELRNLADNRQCTPESLFKPFWRSVAITVVRDLPSRPQKIQQLADFLGLSVNQLLLMTRVETLPFLVLWKRQDAIQRIVQARGKDSSAWSLCVSPKTLNAILSLILVYHPENAEAAIEDCLKHASADFAQEEVSGLLKTQPAAIAFEMLKLAGDSVDQRLEKAQAGFVELTALVERKGQASTRSTATQSRMRTIFFENHALGIMNLISTCIDDTSQPWLERRRALRGLEQMVQLGRGHLSFALPQICACLQSALELQELRNEAFSAWMCLVSHLEAEEDLEGLIEQTFTIIAQEWHELSADSQTKAYEGVGMLIRDHQSLIHNMLDVLPSFGSIPLLSKFENQLSKFRSKMEVGQRFAAFSRRCEEENPTMVLQALRELHPYLDANQQWLHESIATEQPDSSIAALVRSLLGICSRFAREHDEIATLAATCLGIVGCIDPNKLEVSRPNHDMIILSNFSHAAECLDFITFMLENVLVKAFNSAPNARAHSFLAWVMQELLKFCGFGGEASHFYRPQGSQGDEKHQKWMQISESARGTLTPFLTSHYILSMENKIGETKHYPIFSLSRTHGSWLRDFTHDLLQRGKGDNAKQIFSALARVVRLQDLSVATFLLPFAVANVVIGGTQSDNADVTAELLAVLNSPSINDLAATERDILRSCIESVFQVLDYLSRWLHEKRKRVAAARSIAARSGKKIAQAEAAMDESQIKSVEAVLAKIPAEVIANRSVEVHSLSRALQHWETHVRQRRGRVMPPVGAVADEDQPLWTKLHEIYAKIDEPDGLEGINAHLNLLGPTQHIQDHQKAGRWAAAESWYELNLKEYPDDATINEDYMSCLSAAGKHNAVLNHVKCLTPELKKIPAILGSASQAAWNTEQWSDLHSLLTESSVDSLSHFDIGLGTAFDALQSGEASKFQTIMSDLRLLVARSMSAPVTASLQTCHSELLKLQAIHEIELIASEQKQLQDPQAPSQAHLRRRLEVLGSYITDKQYLLGIRRAAMRLARRGYEEVDIAAAWAITAKLARKSNNKDVAYDAANHAFLLGDEYAVFEQARYIWNEGQHRKAIAEVVCAIEAYSPKASQSKDMIMHDVGSAPTHMTRSTAAQDSRQNNLLLAKAHLLHAKWLDRGGQTQSSVINQKYQLATRTFTQWEKGLYYLGKFYNKLLESEKALPSSKQSFQYLSGETAKLVIENYLRSLMFGCKYISETLPRLLTLWLEFGSDINKSISKEVPDDTRVRAMETRPRMMEIMNKQVKKYGERVPSYLFYTALNQMLTRIGHSNVKVFEVLAGIIVRVVAAHPQQGLWALFAVVKSSKADRVLRGKQILERLRERSKSLRHENNSLDIKDLILQGQNLADALLHACNVTVDARTGQVSLTRNLGFSAKVAPCALVVPVERALTASLPSAGEDVPMKSHRAFPMSREAVTISSFADEVLVLSSLQRPRKIVVRGSDGRKYGLLCKPKDDLRKDQRLMEFNAVINKSLKKDAESSKRRLYIRTYAVTPLNEECGVIEWVDGLKAIRDILLNLYRSKGVKVDYSLLRDLLNDASAPNNPEGWRIFMETVLPMYPPALHEWFGELFPSPDSWFGARLRYTRSCAVASMTGHVLGLGDRHGENVLLEESNGGVFHVDFNCLFDKGLTFEKPELVPFRLTHNMVDACGAYGVDGPFRRSAECAMAVMRANQDALLTTLETFVYDPTADFVGGRKRHVKGVPETPKEVLESVQAKVKGLMRGDNVPLSVQGHVEALISQATNPKNLSAMYIGWCAFL